MKIWRNEITAVEKDLCFKAHLWCHYCLPCHDNLIHKQQANLWLMHFNAWNLKENLPVLCIFWCCCVADVSAIWPWLIRAHTRHARLLWLLPASDESSLETFHSWMHMNQLFVAHPASGWLSSPQPQPRCWIKSLFHFNSLQLTPVMAGGDIRREAKI